MCGHGRGGINIPACGTMLICIPASMHVSEQLLECYSDIPSGKEVHDCCRLLYWPYPFRSTDDLEVTSDFIHTQLGISLSVHIFSPVTQVRSTAPVTGQYLLLFSVQLQTYIRLDCLLHQRTFALMMQFILFCAHRFL